jgi:uncharacterized protein DUF6883
MKLPYLENSVVPEKKIKDYLLSTTHRDGKHKAAFFTAIGFTVDDWQELATKLLQHSRDHEVAKIEESPFGKRYVIEGIMETPDGRIIMIRSVWFIDTGESIPRFVTAYPTKEAKK